MSEVETHLREAFEQRLAQISPEREARLRFRSNGRPTAHRSLWFQLPSARATIPAAGTLLTTAIVGLVVVSVISTPQSGSRRLPATKHALRVGRGIGQLPLTDVPETRAKVFERTCRRSFSGTGARVYGRAFAQRPVLTEGRGSYTALITISQQQLFLCQVGPSPTGTGPVRFVSLGSYGHVRAAPRPNRISAPYVAQTGESSRTGDAPSTRKARQNLRSLTSRLARERLAGGGYGNSAVGEAGKNVASIAFTFTGGSTVSATIEHGWYFAWWPWLNSVKFVTVTSSAGITRSRVFSSTTDRPGTLVPGCRQGSAGCVF